jgi:hypothetical protein
VPPHHDFLAQCPEYRVHARFMDIGQLILPVLPKPRDFPAVPTCRYRASVEGRRNSNQENLTPTYLTMTIHPSLGAGSQHLIQLTGCGGYRRKAQMAGRPLLLARWPARSGGAHARIIPRCQVASANVGSTSSQTLGRIAPQIPRHMTA